MHPIYALWSSPRTVSSAMERSMMARGDLTTFHEPFIYLYYLHEQHRVLPHFDIDPTRPTSYHDVRQWILDGAIEGPVFFKDMSYYVVDHVINDPDFCRRLVNTFLIRDPARTIPSYYKLDQDVTLDEIGYEKQYRHFRHIQELTGHTPVVIDGGDLQENAAATIRLYCEAVGLEYLDHALSWGSELPASWADVSGWHADLSGTTGITKNTNAGMDLDTVPHLRDYYEHHRPFYEKLKAHKLEPL